MSISFFCSLFEACLLSLSTTDIAKIAEKNPAMAKLWTDFKKNIDKPIAVILIINTLAHTIGAAISGAQFNKLFGNNFIALFSLVYSLAMIQWTEILPKTIGVNHNIKLAKVSGIPLKILIYIFSPLVFFIHFLNKPFSKNKKDGSSGDILKDISVLSHFAVQNKEITKDQEMILSQTLRLKKLLIKDIMVEKSEIKYLSTKMSMVEALIEAHIHHHTRLPLINNDNINDIIGYINFKDIVTALQINPKDPSLRGICRPIITLYEDENLSVSLNKLTVSYQHIAIVKNHSEEITGLVTLEDILESIIGELNDEYDILPVHVHKIADNRFIIGGGATLKKLFNEYNIAIPDLEITINDWLIEKFGRIPKADEKKHIDGNCFIIRKIRRSSIHELIIETNQNLKTC
jgi:CBS domain containing-hemolysin-like protein